MARERRLVEYEYSLGGEQRPDYGPGKCRYITLLLGFFEDCRRHEPTLERECRQRTVLKRGPL